MTEYSRKQKKGIAEKADKMQKAELGQAEIAKFFKIPVTTLKHWLKDYREGKFDKPDPKEIPTGRDNPPGEQIDTRPALLRIAKAIETSNESLRVLTEGMVKVCLRLDSIYQKNKEEHESFDSLLVKGFKKAGNGDQS